MSRRPPRLLIHLVLDACLLREGDEFARLLNGVRYRFLQQNMLASAAALLKDLFATAHMYCDIYDLDLREANELFNSVADEWNAEFLGCRFGDRPIEVKAGSRRNPGICIRLQVSDIHDLAAPNDTDAVLLARWFRRELSLC